jgi:membrane protein implicated in regulation of membrane protease activity
VRERRRFFLLVLVSDLLAVGVAFALGLEPWLLALVAVAALLPTLTMLVWMTARIRSEGNPSSEAERLGHHDLVPDRDSRP